MTVAKASSTRTRHTARTLHPVRMRPHRPVRSQPSPSPQGDDVSGVLRASRWGNVTSLTLRFSVNGEHRSYALLRALKDDRDAQAIRDCILDAYSRIEAAS